jgi:hypothetical protein
MVGSAFTGGDSPSAAPMTVNAGRSFTFDGQVFEEGWRHEGSGNHLKPVGLKFLSDENTERKDRQQFVLRFTQEGTLRGSRPAMRTTSWSPNRRTASPTMRR